MLIEALEDQHEHVRGSAAEALIQIGPVSVPWATIALKDRRKGVSGGAAYALGRIGPEAKAAVTALVEALNEGRPFYVRRQAAFALGQIGAEANSAIAVLIAALRDKDKDVRIRSATSLGSMSIALTPTQASKNIEQLKIALQAIQSSPDPEVRKHAEAIQQAIDSLGRPWWSWIIGFLQDHPYFEATVVVYLVLPICWLLLFSLHPLSLLSLGAFLSNPFKVKIWKEIEIDLPIQLRHLLLVSLFQYRKRVLNSWVQEYLKTARENFACKPTVRQRKAYVPTPMIVEERTHDSLTPAEVQPVFSKAKSTLLISGEGGWGKRVSFVRWPVGYG